MSCCGTAFCIRQSNARMNDYDDCRIASCLIIYFSLPIGLITGSFNRYRDNTSAGQQGLKRTLPPIEDLPPKRARQDAKFGNNITRIQKPLQTGTPRKTNKKERLKNAIFSKLCN